MQVLYIYIQECFSRLFLIFHKDNATFVSRCLVLKSQIVYHFEKENQ